MSNSAVTQSKLDIARKRVADAITANASTQTLSALNQEVTALQSQLYTERLTEQQQRYKGAVEAAVQRNAGNASAEEISRQHLATQQSIGADIGSFTRGSLRK